MNTSKIKIAFTYLFFLTFVVQGQDLTNQLLAKFLFDGNTGDSSTFHNNLVEQSGGTVNYGADRFGQLNKALKVDGTWFKAPFISGYFIPGGFSVSFWVYSESNITGEILIRRQLPYSMNGAYISNYDYGLSYTDGKVYYQNRNAFLQGQSALPSGQWNHVVFSMPYGFQNNVPGKLYINGQFVLEVNSLSYGYPPSQNDLVVAKFQDYTYGDSNMVDEIYFFGRELGQADVDALYDIDNTTLIKETTVTSADLILFPNPTTSMVFLNGNYTKVEVYNELGALMNVLFENNSLNVSALSKGIYIVKMYDGNNQCITKKLKID